MYGSNIAYHFLVGSDGTIQQNRALTERTGHTRNQPVNLSSIAIVVAGNFQEQEPNEKQLTALRGLIARLDSVYKFEQIIPHRDASPTACPGEKLYQALKDVWRGDDWEVWNITRYYTPVHGQHRYFRSVADKDFIRTAVKQGMVEHIDNEFWYTFTEPRIPIGHSLEEADQWFKDRPSMKEGVRKEMEYKLDFDVNCSGDCLVTSSGYRLKEEDAFKVAACPKEFAFGTKIEIEGIGIVRCEDRGGAIKNKRLDIWAGIGLKAISDMQKTHGGYLRVRFIK